jgi:hypothetical protein
MRWHNRRLIIGRHGKAGLRGDCYCGEETGIILTKPLNSDILFVVGQCLGESGRQILARSLPWKSIR